MHEIKCPKCGEIFQVDDSGYAQLLSQVRDEAFEEELHKRALAMEVKSKDDLKIARMEQEKSFSKVLNDKDKALADKEAEIQQLRNQIALNDSEKKLAISDAVRDKDKEIADREARIIELKSKIDSQKTESALKEMNRYLRENQNAFRVSNVTGYATANLIDIPWWTEENPSNIYPSATFSTDGRFKGLQDRTFVRLQDVTLSYSFKKSLMERWHINNLKLFVSGKNLLTFTRWVGDDPETGSSVLSSTMPVAKSVTAGVSFSF